MLELIASVCASTGQAVGAILPGGPSALVPALALVGLTGGTVHCAPMCGAFVLAQTSARMAEIPAGRLCERHRVAAAALPSYHVGRIAIYSALGAVAGAFGAGLSNLPWLGWLSTALLSAAGLYFLAQGVSSLLPRLAVRRSSPWVRRWLVPAFAAMRAEYAGSFRGLATGLMLGLLPCGFLYAALAAAAASASPILGGAAMLGFGLGTVPSLIAVGWLGAAGSRRWQSRIAALRPYFMLVSAGLLVTLALQVG